MVNGVSSTKSVFLATFDLQNGDIRQVQFVEDGTIMILWTEEGESRKRQKRKYGFIVYVSDLFSL